MAKKRFGPEQVVAKLRQIEVLQASGKSIPAARSPKPLMLEQPTMVQ